ncbi:MAG TPA: hypothetical protein ENI62_10560 [Gammaproteobacteria bacterium]|nr:hypothetical protein [Gammaproteobacteria bacterium]
MKSGIRIATLLFSVIALSGITATRADSVRRDAGSGGSDATHKAQLMMRKLSREKAKLALENTQLTSEIQVLKDQLSEAKKDLKSVAATLSKAKFSNGKLVARVKGDSVKMQVNIARFNKTMR